MWLGLTGWMKKVVSNVKTILRVHVYFRNWSCAGNEQNMLVTRRFYRKWWAKSPEMCAFFRNKQKSVFHDRSVKKYLQHGNHDRVLSVNRVYHRKALKLSAAVPILIARFQGGKIHFRAAGFLFLLCVWDKYFRTQQNLGGNKKFGECSPMATVVTLINLRRNECVQSIIFWTYAREGLIQCFF